MKFWPARKNARPKIVWEDHIQFKASLIEDGLQDRVGIELKFLTLPEGLSKPLTDMLNGPANEVMIKRPIQIKVVETQLRQAILSALKKHFEGCETIEEVAQILQYRIAVSEEDL